MPSHYNFSINRNEGIDIFARNSNIYNVEVKSAKEKTLQKRKGIYKPKMGTFQIKPDDCLHSDFFGFVIKKVDKSTKWTGKSGIYYIDSKYVKKFAKERGKLGKSFKISINQLKNMPKMKLENKKW